MKLANRMKLYESASQFKLTTRMPLIIRVDGKAFHTLTRGYDSPFDVEFMDSMQKTAKYLVDNIQGCKLAYVQSDEISLLLVDYDNFDTQAWFDKKLQKIVSVSASMATMVFNAYLEKENAGIAMFDSRAFVIPKEEVANYFIWRQQDATKNSVQMLARSLFSHKELNNLNGNMLQNKMFKEKDVNWNDLSIAKKRGVAIYNNAIDYATPIFTEDRNYIEKHVYLNEEMGDKL